MAWVRMVIVFVFHFFQSVFKRHHNRFAVGLQAWDERRHPRNGRREAGEENGRWDWRDRGQNEKVKDVRKTTSCQRQKNLGSGVALLPGKFLRVRKVFARINKKPFKLSEYFQNDPDFSR